MDNKYILDTAMKQSAEDLGCDAADFMCGENVIKPFRLGPKARVYLREPITCNMVSYGSNIVAGVTDEVKDIVTAYIGKYTFYHCFEVPNMNRLIEQLAPIGHKVCFMAEYFLPDMNRLTALKCGYDMRVLHQEDFAPLYVPEWSNALCSKRKDYDILGVGAYDGGRLIGLAACSSDCEEMWQIGVDVLPEYRRQGIAAAMTSTLACEIVAAGKVPFYCSAWSNLRSVRNAISSGFRPSWIEMTIKPSGIVDDINK